jgi:hypothetical protein
MDTGEFACGGVCRIVNRGMKPYSHQRGCVTKSDVRPYVVTILRYVAEDTPTEAEVGVLAYSAEDACFQVELAERRKASIAVIGVRPSGVCD